MMVKHQQLGQIQSLPEESEVIFVFLFFDCWLCEFLSQSADPSTVALSGLSVDNRPVCVARSSRPLVLAFWGTSNSHLLLLCVLLQALVFW